MHDPNECPDPFAFNPDRFLSNDGDSDKGHQHQIDPRSYARLDLVGAPVLVSLFRYSRLWCRILISFAAIIVGSGFAEINYYAVVDVWYPL